MFIFLGIVAALSLAVTNILIKKSSHQLDEYAITWGKYVFSLPLLLIALFIKGFPELSWQFWIIIICLMPLEIAIGVLFTRALKISSVSKVIPFTAFTPFFVAVLAFFILGERLTYVHGVAMLFLICGAYLMNLEKEHLNDPFAPFKVFTKEKGAILICIVAILIGITVPLGKMAILYSSPEFFSAMYFLLFSLIFVPIFLQKSSLGLKGFYKNIPSLALIGFMNSIFFLSGWTASKYGPVAVANALVSTDIFFTIVFAGAFLKEKGITQRLLAAIVMFLGVLLINFR